MSALASSTQNAVTYETVTNDWDDTVAALPVPLDAAAGRGRAYLVVVRGSNVGEIYPVLAPDMVIGRAPGADLRLNDEGVSRFHCRLRHEGAGIVIEDLASRNGTFCNGDRVKAGMRALIEGDRLQIGTTSVLRFTYEETVDAVAPPPEAQAGVRDPLTGTFSGRYFVDRLQGEVEFALRHRSPLSLLLLHIDRFADLSATRGQGFIDQLVTGLANHILDNIREEDIVARFTGGEFGLMSRSASPGDTFMLAERLRSSSSGLSIQTTEGAHKITLSLAVAAVSELRIETANDLLIAANTALHRARSQGGDRVVLCTQDLLREPKDGTRV